MGGLCYTKGRKNRFILCPCRVGEFLPWGRSSTQGAILEIKRLPDQVLAGFPASRIGRSKFLFFKSYSISGALPQQHRQSKARYFLVRITCKSVDSLGTSCLPLVDAIQSSEGPEGASKLKEGIPHALLPLSSSPSLLLFSCLPPSPSS